MRQVKRMVIMLGVILTLTSLVACEDLLGGLGDWLSAPYGYVYGLDGVTGVPGAKVNVYKGSTVDSTKLLQTTPATTIASGYFTLETKVSDKGGTFLVVVTPPAGSTLTFENVLVTVPITGYLYNIGTIKPKGGLYSVSGKVINVRALAQTNLPTTGNVEVRKFGETTAVATTAIAANGTYSISGIESGSYLVTYKDTATTPTWIGIPISVELAGGDVSDIGTFVYTGVNATSILLVLTWNNKAYDIDSMSFVGAAGSAIPVTKTRPSSGNIVTWERDVVATLTGVGAAADGSNVIASGVYPVETTLVETLGNGTEMRFYAYAYLSGTSVTGLDDGTSSVQPAGVTLYAMNNGVHFGTWVAPLNTSERAIAMVQLVGNADGSLTIGTFGGTTPRSFAPIFGNGVPVSEMK